MNRELARVSIALHDTGELELSYPPHEPMAVFLCVKGLFLIMERFRTAQSSLVHPAFKIPLDGPPGGVA